MSEETIPAQPRGDSRYRPGKVGPLSYLRAVTYYIHVALATIIIGAIGLPLALFGGRQGANRVASVWIAHMLRAARWHMGIRYEIRGTPPDDDCIVASKHQSFLDILILAHALPQRAFVMKREVLRVPIMGWFAHKVGSVPIDRAKGGEAMKAISEAVTEAQKTGLGQLIIYPEGTRVRPGEKRRYKFGVAAIYESSGLSCQPVAVNAGLFWPKRGIPIAPGVAIVEFLPQIAPGMAEEPFMAELQHTIESASDRLMAEAGFRA